MEPRHSTGGPRYTKCFDEIHKAVRTCNPTIFFAGPEGTSYTDYLIDPKNHEDGNANLVPDILSLHQGMSAGGGGTAYERFFTAIDGMQSGVKQLTQLRDKLVPVGSRKDPAAPSWSPEFVTNEFIPFMNDWCDPDSAQELFDEHPDLKRHPDSPGEVQADGSIRGGCPNWQDPKSNPIKINRKTLGWNGAAAAFACEYEYAYE